MTCLEAQSKIIAYIENKLEKTDKLDFLVHVKNCKECKEELNIYYTMIEGMRQLDENETLSKNFELDLEKRMNQELESNRKKKGAVRGSVLLLVVVLFSFGIIIYVNFLSFLENQEQQALKDLQGEFYFSNTFDSYLFEPYEDKLVLDVSDDDEIIEESFYKKIRDYENLKR
ncbi:MAG: anti-sigma factor family protein [Lachnospiraceae bacterium]